MKNSPVYTIVYVIVFCVLAALALTIPKELWKDRIEANRLYARKFAMVRAAGLFNEGMTREEVEKIFETQITEEDLGYLRVHIARDADGKIVSYLCDGDGMGHEGPFKYIASFEPASDLEQLATPKGASKGAPVRRSRMFKALIVYELQETPGLGGRIADEDWAGQFKNMVFEVSKAGGAAGETEALLNFTDHHEKTNDVIAVTGASETMRSLNQSLNKMAIAMNKGLMLIPLDLELSAEAVTRATPGYPKDFVPPPNLRSLDKRPDFMVPEGLVNLAKGCPVRLIAGNAEGISGELSRLTDWNKKSNEDDYVEMMPSDTLQTVQVDLGDVREIFCVVVWHYYKNSVVYRDVIVQSAEDPDMTVNARILFNNDYDNSAGFGVGTDQPYFAGWWGELVDARPAGRLVQGRRARYINVSTRGGEAEEDTRFVEIAVYGREHADFEAEDESEDNTPAPAVIAENATVVDSEKAVDAAAASKDTVPKALSEFEQIEQLKQQASELKMRLLEPVNEMTDADLLVPQMPFSYSLPENYSDKPQRQFALVPEDVKLLSKECAVSGLPGEDGEPLEGTLEQLVDGLVGGNGSIVELFPGMPQYVQLDLGESHEIYGIAVWHGCREFTVYKDIVVIVADDPEMSASRRVIFNNDYDNSLELGAGKDASYPATGHGHLFFIGSEGKAQPVKGRYVRVYTNGSENGGEDTRLVEIAVFGK